MPSSFAVRLNLRRYCSGGGIGLAQEAGISPDTSAHGGGAGAGAVGKPIAKAGSFDRINR
jgi:hypothetical protein